MEIKTELQIKKNNVRNNIIEILKKSNKPLYPNEIYEILSLDNKNEGLDIDKVKRIIWELESSSIIKRKGNRGPYFYPSKFDKSNIEKITIENLIIEYFKNSKSEISYREIKEYIEKKGFKPVSAEKYISRLVKKGLIIKIKRGTYIFNN